MLDLASDSDSDYVLNEDIYKICKWSEQWCIILNHLKTSSMTFTRKRNSNLPNVVMNDTILTDDKYHTHLGLTLSSDDTWDEHIRRIYEKAAARLNLLRMLKYDLDRRSLLRFYISYIRPTLEYADVVWDNISQQNAQLLVESIQLDACRIITGLRKGTSHDILYRELGLCPLSLRTEHHKLIQFYKILNDEAPPYIKKILANFNEHQTQYSMRHTKLKHPLYDLKPTKPVISYQQLTYGLILIQDLLNATSLYSFKKTLKTKIPDTTKYFSYGNRKYNIILCQLRNSKSQLQSDLFQDHLSDLPTCSMCNAGVPETAQHFLFHCEKYEVKRLDLINSLLNSPTIYSNLKELNAKNLLSGIPEITKG